MTPAESGRLYATLPAIEDITALSAGDCVLVQSSKGPILEGVIVRVDDSSRSGWHPVVVELTGFPYTWRVPLDHVRLMVTTPEPGNDGCAP